MAISTIGSKGLDQSPQILTRLQLPAGSVLQVVEVETSTQVLVSATATPTTIGLSATITPTSATSKILILFNAWVSPQGSSGSGYIVYRNSTQIWNYQLTSAGSGGFNTYITSAPAYLFQNIHTLDSPATTSATTYELKVTVYNGSVYYHALNTYGSSRSSVILMEIAA